MNNLTEEEIRDSLGMKTKPMYEFNIRSAIKVGILLSIVTIALIASFIYRETNTNFSTYISGMIIGATLFPIIGITKYTWPPIFKRVEK